MNKKSTLTVLLLLVSLLVFLSFSGVTYAYLVSGSTEINTTVAGEIKGEITEVFPTENIPQGSTEAVKEVSIKNTGNVPSYVRLRIVFDNSKVENLTEIKYENRHLWTYDEESDFYYYKNLLMPGESTELFMSKVAVDAEQNNEFSIIVYAELIQDEIRQ